MPDVFLSHSSKDDAVVTELHDLLEAATKCEIWVDHKDIQLSDNWRKEIDSQLRDCPMCLVAISRHSVKSEEVMAEWSAALPYGHKLLLAIIDDVPLEDIPSRLQLIQSVNLHTDWDSGLTKVKAAITGTAIDSETPQFMAWPITARPPIDRRLTHIPISGRESDIEAIRQLLTNYPVAIVGVGGLGKSRLAAEIVFTQPDLYGAIWHTASDISRPDDVYGLIREHFGLKAETSDEATLTHLRTRKLLVVLDNMESIEYDDPRREQYINLVNVLNAAGAMALLTSRVEWEDLHLCRFHRPVTLDIQAAQKVVTDMATEFGVKRDLTSQAETIAIAARLHPKLIELAVRQMIRFPPDKIIADLHDLKSAAVQDALDEMLHKTLKQMVNEDGDDTAAILRKLNVCRGGFTYEAAQHISGDISTASLDKILSALQKWLFVTFDGLRYYIDGLVIEAIGEDDTANNPHTDYYLSLFESKDLLHGIDSYFLELPNLLITSIRSFSDLKIDQLNRHKDAIDTFYVNVIKGLEDAVASVVVTKECSVSSRLDKLMINVDIMNQQLRDNSDELNKSTQHALLIIEKNRMLTEVLSSKTKNPERLREAILIFDEQTLKFARRNVRGGYIMVLDGLAYAHLLLGEFIVAVTYFEEVETYYRRIGKSDLANKRLTLISNIKRKLNRSS